MKIIVKGTPKEIADLVLQLQDRQNEYLSNPNTELEKAVIDSLRQESPNLSLVLQQAIDDRVPEDQE